MLGRFFTAYRIGFGAMGIALAVSLADHLARAYDFSRAAAIAATSVSFVVSLPPVAFDHLLEALATISATSMFLGLIVGLAAGESFRFARRAIKWRLGATLAGAAACMAAFIALALAHVSIAQLLLAGIKPLLSVGDTLPALLVIVALQCLLWFAGVHGPALLAALVTPIYLHAIAQNSLALKMHEAPPYIVTIMVFLFIYPGGSGATLPLGMLLLRSPVRRLRRLAFASLLPNVFNVNEVMLFGVPVVMNPTLLVPFVGAPLVLACVTYVAFALHLVSPTTVWLPGAVPTPIAAWLTTNGDWRAVALAGVNVAIATAIYAPFVRNFEARCERRQAPTKSSYAPPKRSASTSARSSSIISASRNERTRHDR